MGLLFLSSVLPVIYIYVCTKFHFNPFSTLQDMARISNHYEKINVYGEITQQICRVGLWFLGSALPLITIYLYTEFYLNAKSSLKVICRTRYRTDGKSSDYKNKVL